MRRGRGGATGASSGRRRRRRRRSPQASARAPDRPPPLAPSHAARRDDASPTPRREIAGRRRRPELRAGGGRPARPRRRRRPRLGDASRRRPQPREHAAAAPPGTSRGRRVVRAHDLRANTSYGPSDRAAALAVSDAVLDLLLVLRGRGALLLRDALHVVPQRGARGTHRRPGHVRVADLLRPVVEHVPRGVLCRDARQLLLLRHGLHLRALDLVRLVRDDARRHQELVPPPERRALREPRVDHVVPPLVHVPPHVPPLRRLPGGLLRQARPQARLHLLLLRELLPGPDQRRGSGRRPRGRLGVAVRRRGGASTGAARLRRVSL
mmetsp:Transcript_7586/g.23959  ORF Transcript_7586/g.23959 Transcript_7586/m.23959 type:complete len:324 (-) Transcript_7586:10-981(-)